MARLLLVACLAGVVVLAGSASPGGSASVPCKAGTRKVAGLTVRDFCGPAKATVRFNGHTYKITNGVCRQEGPIFSIRVGSITLGAAKGKYLYFGADLKAAHDGTFHDAAMEFQFPGGSGFVWENTVTLSGTKHHGGFGGWVFGHTKPVAGSFTC